MIRREPTRGVGTPASDGRNLATVHAGISDYYTGKIKKFGATPLGMDWTCVPTQQVRFIQLLKLCDFTAPFSLNDLGCGYGALRRPEISKTAQAEIVLASMFNA